MPEQLTTGDHYAELGVTLGAHSEEIKAAYRKRARLLHPDVNKSDPDAAERFKRLVAAYEVLSDPLRRAAYDRDRDRPGGLSRGSGSGGMRPSRWEGPRRQPLQVWTPSRPVELWERTGRSRGRRAEAAVLHRAVISPDARRLATHRGEIVTLWDPAIGRSVASTGREQQGISWVGFSPDGRFLITQGVRGTVLWDAASGREVDRLNLDGTGNLSLSANGRRLATAVHTLAQVSEVHSGRELAQLPHERVVQSIALGSDGRRLATGADTTAYVWDVDGGREVARMPHDKPPAKLELSPDGRFLATCTTVARSRWTPSPLHFWDIESAREMGRLQHGCWIDQIVFSPDGRRLATDSNGTLHLWDLTVGRELAQMRFINSEVVFSPDSRWLAAAAGDDVYLLDAESGHQLASLEHPARVVTLAVGPDGRQISTGSRERGDETGRSPVLAQTWLMDVTGAI